MRSRGEFIRPYIAVIPRRDDMPRPQRSAGFAMLDSLVALLLFALVLLGAIAVLIQGMRATHAAVLTSRAVDLASDFLEQRRALPPGAAVEPLFIAWQEHLQELLPEAARGTATELVEPLLAGSGAAP
jgi:type II secretory pathway pseudopilin PulG